jgi:hypothetical protein
MRFTLVNYYFKMASVIFYIFLEDKDTFFLSHYFNLISHALIDRHTFDDYGQNMDDGGFVYLS